jgi:hypothetical protein
MDRIVTLVAIGSIFIGMFLCGHYMSDKHLTPELRTKIENCLVEKKSDG